MNIGPKYPSAGRARETAICAHMPARERASASITGDYTHPLLYSVRPLTLENPYMYICIYRCIRVHVCADLGHARLSRVNSSTIKPATLHRASTNTSFSLSLSYTILLYIIEQPFLRYIFFFFFIAAATFTAAVYCSETRVSIIVQCVQYNGYIRSRGC